MAWGEQAGLVSLVIDASGGPQQQHEMPLLEAHSNNSFQEARMVVEEERFLSTPEQKGACACSRQTEDQSFRQPRLSIGLSVCSNGTDHSDKRARGRSSLTRGEGLPALNDYGDGMLVAIWYAQFQLGFDGVNEMLGCYLGIL